MYSLIWLNWIMDDHAHHKIEGPKKGRGGGGGLMVMPLKLEF